MIPDNICQLEMCLKCFPLMFGRVSSCFFLIRRYFFLVKFFRKAFAWIWPIFWFLIFGPRHLERSLITFVDWKCLWNASLWCWGGSLVVFSLYGDPFYWALFICFVYMGDFEVFWGETLRREFSGEKFGTWVAWKFRPDSLLLKCCPNMPWDGAKEFPLSINFWKKLGQIESTVFKL